MLLYLYLLERVGFIIALAYIMMQFPVMRRYMEYQRSFKYQFVFVVIFSILAIFGTNSGIKVGPLSTWSIEWVGSVDENQAITNVRSIGIILAGLLGGIYPALWVGVIAAIHRLYVGGFLASSVFISIILQAIVAGAFKKSLQEQRGKKYFLLYVFIIGGIVESLLMIVIFFLMHGDPLAVGILRDIALPQILANSLGVTVFFHFYNLMKKIENEQISDYTGRALNIARQTLPQWQKFSSEGVKGVLDILYRETKALGVSFELENRIVEKIGSRTDYFAIIFFHTSDKQKGKFHLYYQGREEVELSQNIIESGLQELLNQQFAYIEIEKQKELLLEAELRELRAQMNPHFLFNLLNTIKSFIRTDPNKARILITQLAKFLRKSINPEAIVTIEEELLYVNVYLDLIHARIEERINVQMKIDESTKHFYVPAFSIQPLLENAIEHGLKNKVKDGQVIIRIQSRGEKIIVHVYDNGEWNQDTTEHKGIALENLKKRLFYYYGDKHNLRIKTGKKGTNVSFYVLRRDGQNENTSSG